MEVELPNGWQPRSYQLPAWRYLQGGGTHAELIWHRRAGKDEVALHRTACAAFERTAAYWHMLPEAAQARKAIWDMVNPHTGKRRIDEAFPQELRSRTLNNEMQITFKNESTWQVVGSDNFNSLVGSAPAGIVYSEWALSNPNAKAYLRPILAENGGWQIFIGSPRGRNHAHASYKQALKSPGSFAQILDVSKTGVFTQEALGKELADLIGDLGEEYGRSRYEQEYECSFDAANLGAILGRGVGRAETDGRIHDGVLYDPLGGPIHISSDIGRRDTATWYFWQPKLGGYSLIDHDAGWGLDAEEWCHRLKERLSKYTPEGADKHNPVAALGKIWLPHDARAKTFAAKRSAVEIFLEKFGMKHVDITPSTSISDRINAGRVLMPRCEFHATNCETALNGLRAWSYEYNEDTKTFGKDPKHDWASHEGDGFTYGCVVMSLVSPAPPKPEKPRFLHETTINELFEMDNLTKSRSRI